jgi:predicted HTH transcriptional regulator
MNQQDLFAYPNSAGWRRTRTSRQAAAAIQPRVATLRERVLALLKDASLTADECAAKLDKSILSIRPRLSELLALGKIEDTGRTRKNDSGVQATVWRAV